MLGQVLRGWRALRAFFAAGIWELRLEDLPVWKAAAVRGLRILAIAVSEFLKDDCALRASALTFYTLLSVVPILGVAFGIAKGFGLEKMLEEQLLAQMAGQEQALERILSFTRNMLDSAKGDLIAGVGVVLMIWAALKILGQIEAALNAMWDIRQLRSWGRRFSDYLAVLLVAPILMLTASGANVFIRTRLDDMAARLGLLETVGPAVVHLLQLTPILLAWALFTLMYACMPNTRIRLLPALAGGAIGGCLYHLAQWVYIAFQVGMAKQNAIYGSFAALPLFLAWVQTSWFLFLFGGEIVYAVQHADLYPFKHPERRELTGLHAAWLVVHRFVRGEAPPTAADLARATGTPLSVVRGSLETLVRAGLLAETRPLDQAAYLPAVDPALLTLQRVWDALREPPVPALGPAPDSVRLQGALNALRQAAAQSPANRPLRDI
jgi:membrane protein